MTTMLREQSQLGQFDIVVTPQESGFRQVTRRQMRAKQAVTIGLVFFLMSLFFLQNAVQSDLLPIRDPIFRDKLALLQQHPEFFQASTQSVRVMALGSSRTQLGFHGKLFAERWEQQKKQSCRAFNFGCASCGPVAIALYFRELLRQGLQLDVLLIEIHPAMLVDQNPPLEADWLHDYRLREMDLSVIRSYGWPRETPRHLRPFGWWQSLSEYRFSLLNEYAPAMLPCPFGLNTSVNSDPYGFVQQRDPKTQERPLLLAKAYQEYYEAFATERIGGPALEAIRDIIRLAHPTTKVWLYISPESSEFQSFYQHSTKKMLNSTLNELAHDTDIRWIPSRSWLPDLELVDGHHPSAAGAERFTLQLADAIFQGDQTP